MTQQIANTPSDDFMSQTMPQFTLISLASGYADQRLCDRDQGIWVAGVGLKGVQIRPSEYISE